jgi:hypothetical protein
MCPVSQVLESCASTASLGHKMAVAPSMMISQRHAQGMIVFGEPKAGLIGYGQI